MKKLGLLILALVLAAMPTLATGEPEVTLVATGLLADDPTFMASLENERLALEDDVSDFKAYPVISLSFVYNF